MSNTLYIKKNKLPVTSDESLEYLYDYFNEFEIECLEFDDYFQINLIASQYTYCEDISNGLEFLNVKKNEIKNYCIVQDKVALCLSENWLPFAFSKHFPHPGNDISDLTILHIDDHRDLMSPYLSYQDGHYFDMITGGTVQFTDCSSVKRAVESGAITIGSMLTTIIYSLSQVDIFHIKEKVNYRSYKLKKVCISDNLLSDDCKRIAIQIDEEDGSLDKYHVTSEWNDVLNHLDVNKPCLLHIDMDYFNNRYNASTNWMENQNRHDLSFPQQKVLMDKLFDGVKKVMEQTEIRYVLLGISPSFYPVEYWCDGLCYLVRGLENIGLPIGNILRTCKLENTSCPSNLI